MTQTATQPSPTGGPSTARRRRRAAAAAIVTGTIAGTVAAPEPAHAEGCLTRTWGQVCAWPNFVGNYLSYNDIERVPVGGGEIVNQCDVQGVSRTLTDGGREQIYESAVDLGCWPTSANLDQKAFTMRHYGRYKSVDNQRYIDSVCAGWREHAPNPEHDWFHFHGFGCVWI